MNQESYKLDHIASVELGEKKVEYEYDHFKDFYTNDFQLFVEYNHQDVKLVQKLEKKLGLMELALALAYTAKVNLGDVFSQVRTWDQIIYHHLRAKDIVIPRKKNGGKKDGQIIRCVCEGADHWSARLGCVLRPQQSVSSPHHAIQHLSRYKGDVTGRIPQRSVYQTNGVLDETDLFKGS